MELETNVSIGKPPMVFNNVEVQELQMDHSY